MIYRRLFTRALVLAVPVVFAFIQLPLPDALGRAGRGGSYRSSGGSSSGSGSRSSGSSYRSSGSSSYRSSYGSGSSSTYKSGSSSSTKPVYGGSSSSGGGSSSGAAVPSYPEAGYNTNAYSAVLKINTDASVDITETFDVTLTGEGGFISRPIDVLRQYLPLNVAQITSPQGQAFVFGDRYLFGYKDRKVSGRQTFTLTTRVTGAVVPHGDGARLDWRTLLGREHAIDTIRVDLPAGAAAVSARAVIIPARDTLMHYGTDLQCQVTGGSVTVPVKKTTADTVDLSVVLPKGAVDAAAMENAIKPLIGTSQPHLSSYTTRITLNRDRTIDRQDVYEYAPDGPKLDLSMRTMNNFSASYLRGDDDKALNDVATNTLYIYDINKKPCRYYNYTSWAVCIPGENTAGKKEISYSMSGNYKEKNPYFFDVTLPPAAVNRAGRVRLEITFPPFVRKEQADVRLYLCKQYAGSTMVLHRENIEGRWEGQRFSLEYDGGLYGDQSLLARVFLPEAGFTKPNFFKKMRILASYHVRFNTGAFWAVIISVVLMLGLFVVLPIWLIVRGKKKSAPPVFKSDLEPAKKANDEASINAVKAEDPAFQVEAFLERVKTIAGKVQSAWSAGNMSPVRNYVSQGVYNRFRIQLRLMRDKEGVVNLMDDFTVKSLAVAGSSMSKGFHTLHVQVQASARDVTVPVSMPDDERKKELSRAEFIHFTEIYSFTRKRGAMTDPSKDWLKGQCPACGNVPDSFGDTNRCPKCGSIYNSGEYDWVLSEITQLEEWKPGSSGEVKGLAALEGENLSMNRAVIEDRASYLFWCWIDCLNRGSAEPLRRDATESLLASLSVKEQYLAETAVGSVDLKEVAVMGGTARAAAVVLWSASFSKGAEPAHREHRLTMAMPAATKNPYGFADHSCDSCGAPLPESDVQVCGYCGEPLQKANSDWLLENIEEV